MRFLLFVSGIIVGTASIGSRAEAETYPWCALYSKGGGEVSCSFSTWEQCLADVSGIGGFCQANNLYVAAVPNSPRRPRHKSTKN
jgi:uncharacterized protein DUF3551